MQASVARVHEEGVLERVLQHQDLGRWVVLGLCQGCLSSRLRKGFCRLGFSCR